MSIPAWVVRGVEPMKDHRLLITFASGELRIYDARLLLAKPIFSALNDIDFFMRAQVSGDTVIWNDDVDIAPEHLYETSIPVNE